MAVFLYLSQKYLDYVSLVYSRKLITFAESKLTKMSAESFTFKQFLVRQEHTAMKVGTDGVLLGAWAQGGSRILDVGTGTGLIALMMAQRFPDAKVVGIDIDGEACMQAKENISASKFSIRVEVMNVFLQELEVEECFDSIVSNPPFFIDSLHAPDERRTIARHNDTLPFGDLMSHSARLLSQEGVLSVVAPADLAGHLIGEAALAGLFLQRKIMVKTTPRKVAKRCLLAFGKHSADNFENVEVCLLDTEGNRSEWYDNITKDFYL